MMAERAMKDLHMAMLDRRYDDALQAAFRAIEEVNNTSRAIVQAKEQKK